MYLRFCFCITYFFLSNYFLFLLKISSFVSLQIIVSIEKKRSKIKCLTKYFHKMSLYDSGFMECKFIFLFGELICHTCSCLNDYCYELRFQYNSFYGDENQFTSAKSLKLMLSDYEGVMKVLVLMFYLGLNNFPFFIIFTHLISLSLPISLQDLLVD